ncbi:LTA synthase family protein [Tsuneonella sp. HG222]
MAKVNHTVGCWLARVLRPWPAIPLAVVLLGALELAVADRKYGVFTGGFGMSSAVDRPGEILAFAAGYGVAQALAALLAWWLVDRLTGRRRDAATMLHFLFVYLGLSLLALTAQYQLHSYFSDAVDFALIQRLGGGSLSDALLFGKNEIALGILALLAVGGTWWVLGKLIRRFIDRSAAPFGGPPGLRTLAALGTAMAAGLLTIPPLSEDATRGLNRTLAWNAAMNLGALGTDFDRDGYGLVGLHRDPHPLDSRRHPLALDVPGNGVDEDGYGGDLALVPIPAPRPAAGDLGRRPHVVIVVLESTRADALTKVIDGKPVAPNLQAIARRGGSIAPSYSHVGFTTESLKSIFSGQLVPRSGDPSLFSELKAAGYRVGVFSGQPEDFGGISETVAMRGNADVFVDAETLKSERAFSFAAQGSLLVDEGKLLREFDRRLGAPEGWRQPTMLYVNFQSPHFPYDHPGVGQRFAHPPIARGDITQANRERVERTYWNAVAHSDAALGELVSRLERLGVWDDTIMLVTGDHGEALFEDGFLGHGHVIERAQFATFLASNRPLGGLRAPLAISDYRGVLLDLIAGRAPRQPAARPFMYIGELDRPTAIGLDDAALGLVSLRLDTGETCFRARGRCHAWRALEGAEKAAAERLVARWGSERWAVRKR